MFCMEQNLRAEKIKLTIFFSEDVPTSGSFMQLTALHCAALVITNDDVDICQKFKVFSTKTNVRQGIRVAFRENRMN